MANYFTHFSFTAPIADSTKTGLMVRLYNDRDPKILEWFEDAEMDGEEVILYNPFSVEIDALDVWIYDEDAESSLSVAAEFVSALIQAGAVTGPVEMTAAHTCSKPRVGAFYGSTLTVDADGTIIWDPDREPETKPSEPAQAYEYTVHVLRFAGEDAAFVDQDDEEACKIQLARELQEGWDEAGIAGSFKVSSRRVEPDSGNWGAS